MDKKAWSFLSLGLLLGILVASGVFSMLSRRQALAHQSAPQSSAEGTKAQPEVEKTVLKLAHVLDQSHPVHAAMEFMAKRLAEESKGAIELQIFPNGQLGSETESIEQVQRGALAMVKTSAAPLEGFIPEMAVFGLPYLFRDADHYWRVLLGPIGKELLQAGASVGLRGLCYYDSGSRSFYTIKNPVMSPADLAGKKIRVMRSKTAMDMVSTLGGSPTPIPWGELYTALQQGMVDGAENNPPSLFSSRHFEVTKNYSLDEHARIPDMVLFSQEIWDSLDAQKRAWIEKAADDSVTFQRKLWNEKTEEALSALKNAGVKIYEPDKAAFAAKVQPMYDGLDPKLSALVKRIRDVK